MKSLRSYIHIHPHVFPLIVTALTVLISVILQSQVKNVDDTVLLVICSIAIVAICLGITITVFYITSKQNIGHSCQETEILKANLWVTSFISNQLNRGYILLEQLWNGKKTPSNDDHEKKIVTLWDDALSIILIGCILFTLTFIGLVYNGGVFDRVMDEPAEVSNSSATVLTDSQDGIQTFVQLTDMHLADSPQSIYIDYKKTLVRLKAVINPGLLLITGDIIDGLLASGDHPQGYAQISRVWQMYKKLNKEQELDDITKLIDVRGNHDVYGLATMVSSTNYFCDSGVSRNHISTLGSQQFGPGIGCNAYQALYPGDDRTIANDDETRSKIVTQAFTLQRSDADSFSLRITLLDFAPNTPFPFNYLTQINSTLLDLFETAIDETNESLGAHIVGAHYSIGQTVVDFDPRADNDRFATTFLEHINSTVFIAGHEHVADAIFNTRKTLHLVGDSWINDNRPGRLFLIDGWGTRLAVTNFDTLSNDTLVLVSNPPHAALCLDSECGFDPKEDHLRVFVAPWRSVSAVNVTVRISPMGNHNWNDETDFSMAFTLTLNDSNQIQSPKLNSGGRLALDSTRNFTGFYLWTKPWNELPDTLTTQNDNYGIICICVTMQNDDDRSCMLQPYSTTSKRFPTNWISADEYKLLTLNSNPLTLNSPIGNPYLGRLDSESWLVGRNYRNRFIQLFEGPLALQYSARSEFNLILLGIIIIALILIPSLRLKRKCPRFWLSVYIVLLIVFLYFILSVFLIGQFVDSPYIVGNFKLTVVVDELEVIEKNDIRDFTACVIETLLQTIGFCALILHLKSVWLPGTKLCFLTESGKFKQPQKFSGPIIPLFNNYLVMNAFFIAVVTILFNFLFDDNVSQFITIYFTFMLVCVIELIMCPPCLKNIPRTVLFSLVSLTWGLVSGWSSSVTVALIARTIIGTAVSFAVELSTWKPHAKDSTTLMFAISNLVFNIHSTLTFESDHLHFLYYLLFAYTIFVCSSVFILRIVQKYRNIHLIRHFVFSKPMLTDFLLIFSQVFIIHFSELTHVTVPAVSFALILLTVVHTFIAPVLFNHLDKDHPLGLPVPAAAIRTLSMLGSINFISNSVIGNLFLIVHHSGPLVLGKMALLSLLTTSYVVVMMMAFDSLSLYILANTNSLIESTLKLDRVSELV